MSGKTADGLSAKRVVGGRATLAMLVGTMTAPVLLSAQVHVTGTVGTEVRVFPDSPRFSGQDRHMASAYFAPVLAAGLARGQTLTVAPFLRVISDRRLGEPVAYLRTLAWTGLFGKWSAGAGIQTVRWGSTRLRSPVDVVNQIDRSFHPFANARIGQAMLRLRTERGWGDLELLAMSRVQPRDHPRRHGRLRPSAWVDPSSNQYLGGAGGPLEVAGRWSKELGRGVVGISALHGTGRDPRYQRTDGDPSTLVSVYEPFTQLGFDGRVAQGDWIFKAESALRHVGAAAPYVVTVVGLDRVLRNEHLSATFAAEYVRDSRGRRATTIVEDDIYLEARVRTSREEPLEISTRFLIDRSSGSTVWTAQAQRPVAKQWLLQVGTWQFRGADLGSLRQDGYLWVAMQHSF